MLAEAVRALDLLIVVKKDVERVRLNTPPEEFPGKLLELQKALMALDSAESHAAGASKGDMSLSDSERESFHKVSDALIHQIQKKYKDNRKAVDIVNEAIQDFAGAGWVEPVKKIYDGRTRRKAQERREERALGAMPRLSDKTVQGLDSAIYDAEMFRRKAMERAKQDMARRALLQAQLSDEDQDEDGAGAIAKQYQS